MLRAFHSRASTLCRILKLLLRQNQGSAILEFAISLPVLVVFIVGIYDFGGAFNEKQKIAQAVQEGAIVAGAQPTSDIDTTVGSPDSLQPVVAAVFNSLASSGVLPQSGGSSSTCSLPAPNNPPTNPTQVNLKWTYTFSSCSNLTPSDLVIAINRGRVFGGTPVAVGTTVTVTYPYNWRFNSAIQLIFPGSSNYKATTYLTESATVHNQT